MTVITDKELVITQSSPGFLSLVEILKDQRKKNIPTRKDLPKIPTKKELTNRLNLFMRIEGAMNELKKDHERYQHYLHAYRRVSSGLEPTQYPLSAIEVMKPLRVNGITI
jgi:hypothetical protein